METTRPPERPARSVLHKEGWHQQQQRHVVSEEHKQHQQTQQMQQQPAAALLLCCFYEVGGSQAAFGGVVCRRPAALPWRSAECHPIYRRVALPGLLLMVIVLPKSGFLTLQGGAPPFFDRRGLHQLTSLPHNAPGVRPERKRILCKTVY